MQGLEGHGEDAGFCPKGAGSEQRRDASPCTMRTEHVPLPYPWGSFRLLPPPSPNILSPPLNSAPHRHRHAQELGEG